MAPGTRAIEERRHPLPVQTGVADLLRHYKGGILQVRGQRMGQLAETTIRQMQQPQVGRAAGVVKDKEETVTVRRETGEGMDTRLHLIGPHLAGRQVGHFQPVHGPPTVHPGQAGTVRRPGRVVPVAFAVRQPVEVAGCPVPESNLEAPVPLRDAGQAGTVGGPGRMLCAERPRGPGDGPGLPTLRRNDKDARVLPARHADHRQMLPVRRPDDRQVGVRERQGGPGWPAIHRQDVCIHPARAVGDQCDVASVGRPGERGVNEFGRSGGQVDMTGRLPVVEPDVILLAAVQVQGIGQAAAVGRPPGRVFGPRPFSGLPGRQAPVRRDEIDLPLPGAVP
jgi:hypothetical protein